MVEKKLPLKKKKIKTKQQRKYNTENKRKRVISGSRGWSLGSNSFEPSHRLWTQ